MHLNLARKWRSKHFDEVVGQPLVVRLVKNSLYRNLIFPVYLLSGTRGCGKTSIARIFAAALNCEALEQFQKNPQEQQLPCLTCASCLAMQATKHPDFIEIDAASHTGVDNVRAIIDAASFVPVLGKKKIYLIDEAHMLSKAAFNAFLKILEEPPISVVFMLATTDPHKIIETVTSRCFQLFFEPIELHAVADHLAHICAKEEVAFEKEALLLIAQETEGSMRDALNLVERVRIAYPSITHTAVIELLGKIDDERLCELLQAVIQGSPQDILATIKHLDLEKYNPYLLWKSFVELIRRSLWVKNGSLPDESKLIGTLKEITASCSLERLIRLFEICYDYELSFAKTAAPGHMLEMMLLKMAQKTEETSQNTSPKKSDNSASKPATRPSVASTANARSIDLYVSATPTIEARNVETPSAGDYAAKAGSVPVSSTRVSAPDVGITNVGNPAADTLDAEASKVDTAVPSAAGAPNTPNATPLSTQSAQELLNHDSPWAHCLQEIEKLNDPLVVSIFKQGILSAHDAQAKSLDIIFSQDLLFFKEWLENTQKVWQPTISRFFGEGTLLVPHFTGAAKERTIRIGQHIASPSARVAPSQTEQSGTAGTDEASVSRAAMAGRPANERSASERLAPAAASSYARKEGERGHGGRAGRVPTGRAPTGRVVTITDPEKWQKAHALLRIFPGTLTVSQENPDGETV